MPDYRLYLLDDNGRIKGVIELDCEDDDRAGEAVEQQRDGHDMELWNRSRFVKAFPKSG
jgi:hypothetical protein